MSPHTDTFYVDVSVSNTSRAPIILRAAPLYVLPVRYTITLAHPE